VLVVRRGNNSVMILHPFSTKSSLIEFKRNTPFLSAITKIVSRPLIYCRLGLHFSNLVYLTFGRFPCDVQVRINSYVFELAHRVQRNGFSLVVNRTGDDCVIKLESVTDRLFDYLFTMCINGPEGSRNQ
jgi:hypothetical protein